MTKEYFVRIDATNPANAFIASANSASTATLTITKGDVFTVRLYLLEGELNPRQGFELVNPGAFSVVKFGVRKAGGADMIALITSWTQIGGAYLEGTCTVDSTAAAAALGSAVRTEVIFELELSEDIGAPLTVAQAGGSLLAQMIESGGVATVEDPFVTLSEMNAAIAEQLQPVLTFADAAAVAAAAPAYIGQLAIQLDQAQLYYGIGTSVGNYTSFFRFNNLFSNTALVALGTLSIGKTITAAGTTGAQTINKCSGSVNFAAGAQTLVVTNSNAGASSVILASIATDDATATSVKAINGSGQFTLKLNATATAETRVNWQLTN